MARDHRSWAERFDDTIRPVLAPDEALLAASPLMPDPGTSEDVSLRDELASLADPTLWLGLGAHPGAAGQRLIFGRAVVGAEGSIAHRMFTAVDRASAPFLAVTPDRIVVVDRVTSPRPGAGRLATLFGASDTTIVPLVALSRSAVVAAATAPKGVARRARLLVRFADESVCALNCALPGVRDEVVEALGGSR